MQEIALEKSRLWSFPDSVPKLEEARRVDPDGPAKQHMFLIEMHHDLIAWLDRYGSATHDDRATPMLTMPRPPIMRLSPAPSASPKGVPVRFQGGKQRVSLNIAMHTQITETLLHRFIFT